MNTELVTTQQPGQIMPPPPPPVEVDDTGLSDFIKMKPSRLALVQHQTLNPMGANAGQVLDTESGQIYDNIELVVLKMHASRVFFKPGEKISAEAEPLCRSWDAKFPANDVKQSQSSSCANCPQAQWHDKTAPPCKEKLELAVATTEDGMPHYFSVGGKSISPVRKVLGLISKQLQKKTLASLHHAAITLRGVKSGMVYMLEVVNPTKDTTFKTLTDEEAAPYISLKREMNAQSTHQDVVDAEFTADEAVDGVVNGEIIVQQQV